jgi:hypothetical protein
MIVDDRFISSEIEEDLTRARAQTPHFINHSKMCLTSMPRSADRQTLVRAINFPAAVPWTAPRFLLLERGVRSRLGCFVPFTLGMFCRAR